jgi:hypothetical protein
MAATVFDWEPAPHGRLLSPGRCRARDSDGQGCARGVAHLLHSHQSLGLRSWLEAADERAIIRCYEADLADEHEAMEARLFSHFDFHPVARQEIVRTHKGGLDLDWALIVGNLAPQEEVTFAIRAVCFARDGS